MTTAKFHLSAPHTCPYLAAETAALTILGPTDAVTRGEFSFLLQSGFRRSGPMLYKPHCRRCNACISVRIPAARYQPNRSQRRCLKKNAMMVTTHRPAYFNDEHFALYCRYQSARHRECLMTHENRRRYQALLGATSVDTSFIEFRLAGRLVAVAVCDLTNDGMSAVYTFFDPRLPQHSLGTYAIIKQLDYVRAMQLDWLYLGYWINGYDKMHYKINFSPLYGYIDATWQKLPSHRASA